MAKREGFGSAAGQGLIADLLEESEFDSEFAKKMLGVFLEVCGTLKVSDPADPLSKSIARTLILIASEGERDPAELRRRTLRNFQPDN